MRFVTLLATTLLTNIATFSTATTPDNSVGTINFCDEPNLGGECSTSYIVAEQCTLIPDSNAKGDGGSSYQVSLFLPKIMYKHVLIRF